MKTRATRPRYSQANMPGAFQSIPSTPRAAPSTPVPGSPFAAGINPVSIVVEPTGSFAYSASTKYTTGYTGFAQILGYSIDASTGALTPFRSPAFSDVANSNGAQLVVATGAVTPNPVPMISSLNPPSIAATGVPFTLQVNGANFVPGATVYFGGQVRSTTFVSSTQLSGKHPGDGH